MSNKQKRMGVLAGCAMAAAMVLLPVERSMGSQLLFSSNGFEPSLTNPDINYQAGFTLAGQPFTTPINTVPAADQFTSSVGVTGTQPAASVQNYVTSGFAPIPGNTQFAVVADNAISPTAVGEFYPEADLATPFTPSAANGTQVVNIAFSMAVTASGGGEPLFGVTAFSGGRQIGELLVDAANGDVIGGTTNVSSFKPTLGAGNFYSYELQLNYATQSYSLFEATPGVSSSVQLIGSSPFQGGAAPVSTFTYAALTSFALPGTTATSSGDGLFDDYTVTATAVPEPTVASLVVAGVAMTVGGRRRRRAAAR